MLDRVASPPTRGTLSTCPGHLARRGSFLPCKLFVLGYPGYSWAELNRENYDDGARWNFSWLPFASVICRTQWQSVTKDQYNRWVSGREQVRARAGSWNKMEKSLWLVILFVVLSGRSKDSPHSPLTVPVRWVACKGELCVNPSGRIAQLAGAPYLHVNWPLVRGTENWKELANCATGSPSPPWCQLFLPWIDTFFLG